METEATPRDAREITTDYQSPELVVLGDAGVLTGAGPTGLSYDGQIFIAYRLF